MRTNDCNITLTCAVVACLTVAAGCGGAKIKTRVAQPGEADVAIGRVLGVYAAEGRWAQDAANVLTAELAQNAAATGAFKVVERAGIGAANYELRIGASALASDAQAAEAGKRLGADVVIYVETPECAYSETTEARKDTCTRTTGKGKNKKTEKYPCTWRTRRGSAKCVIVFRATDVSTGTLLGAKRFEYEDDASKSELDGEPDPIDGDAMLSEMVRFATRTYVPLVAPHPVDVEVRLETHGDAPELELGNRYAETGDWAKAGELYGKAVTRLQVEPEAPAEALAASLYNLGTALAYQGRFDEGRGLVEQAYELSGDEDYYDQVLAIGQLGKAASALGANTNGGGAASAERGR